MGEKKMAKHWSAFMTRGIITILFGILALFASGFTLDLLLIFIGFFLLLGGLVSVIGAFAAIGHKHWWILLFNGLITIAAGIVVFAWPEITLLILVYLVALWAIVTGLFEFIASIAAPWAAPGKVMIGIVGVLSVILGIVMFVYPGLTINAMIWLVGIYALIIGISLVFFSIRLKAQD